MFYAANRQLGIFQKSEPDPLLGGVPAGRGGYVLPNILQTHPCPSQKGIVVSGVADNCSILQSVTHP
ncbi:MAG: hypothetical protein HC940_08710 [Acaryochloris sp. SU_5_25]|nr:hypothetical protein [Acaryochloris sp. SU_5_25]